MVLSSIQTSHQPVETVLGHLNGVHTSLHGWVACCPAHYDREPSLSIGLGSEGQVLLNCFAGCPFEQIVEAMGITVAELFPRVLSMSEAPPEQTQPSDSFLLILRWRSGYPGSTSSTWASLSKELDASRSPITCPTAPQLPATGFAPLWSLKRDHTGVRVQVRSFRMGWNAWKKPEKRAISSL